MALSQLQINRINDIFINTKKNDNLFNWTDNSIKTEKIRKKFNNAIESYVGYEATDNDEMYLFLFDDTLFGSAKEGFLITSRAIYFKELGKNANKVEFANATSAISHERNRIFIAGQEINMTFLDEATDSIVKILNELIEYNTIDSTLYEIKNWLENINDADGNAKDLLNDLEGYLKDIDKNINNLNFLARNFFDYTSDNAKKYVIMLIKYIEPLASTFKEFLDIAETVSEKIYINDKEWANKLFKKADCFANTVSFKIDLATTLWDNKQDDGWARTTLANAELKIDDNPNFNEYLRLAEVIADMNYANDKEWAKRIYKKALDTNPIDSDYIKLCESISYEEYLNDKVWAKDLIKKYIASEEQVEYKKIIDLASEDYYLNDVEFTKDIFKNAKEQCHNFEDYLELFNAIDNCSQITSGMLLDFVFEIIEKLENKKQKKKLIKSIDWTINDEIVNIIKSKSIQELKDMYCKKDENDFDDDLVLELPSYEEIKSKDDDMELQQDEFFVSEDGFELSLEEVMKDEDDLEQPFMENKTSDLKTLYAQKISSGEIDPIKISFADFEATQSKPKEIDYKTVYIQMIDEGRIDPSETSFDEMVNVAKIFGGKDESEFKTLYSQNIVSGEIDPAETTYDEIVNIAKIFNEINCSENKLDLMEDIYQYLIKNVNDDNDDLVENFLELKESEDSYDFVNFAEEMYDFGLELDKIKYLLDRSYQLADSYVNYKAIANVILDNNSPQVWNEWAKELYKESEAELLVVDDILDLAYSIGHKLEDDDWAISLYRRAVKESTSFDEMLSVANDVAQFDCAAINIENNSWAKEIYKKAEALAEEFEEYKKLADNTSNDVYIGDKEWGKELFEVAKEKASEIDDYQSLIELLANENNFDDTDYARKLSYDTLKKFNSFDDHLKIIYATSPNSELHKEITLETIKVMKTDDEKTRLIDELYLEDDDTLMIDINDLSVDELKNKYAK